MSSRAVGTASGWSDVLQRAKTLRRRRRRNVAVILVAVSAASLMASFAARGGFGIRVGHSQDSPLTVLSGALRDGRGEYAGTIEIEMPGTVSLIASRPAHVASAPPAPMRLRKEQIRLRPIRVLRTAEGPRSTTASFKARWFLDVGAPPWPIASASLRSTDASGRTNVRLCGPCLHDDAGRITLALNDATALVNERLRLEVLTAANERVASAPVERVHTPVYWPGRRGLVGGWLECMPRTPGAPPCASAERNRPPPRVDRTSPR